MEKKLTLKPSTDLVKLIKESQEARTTEKGEGEVE
jgi:hypothetical protein